MTPSRSVRFLEPSERVAEVLFGLIMVLTFTGSLSVAEADRTEVRTMLIGALGCNCAWGIIDGILYLMGGLAEQGRGIRAWRALRDAPDKASAHRVIAGALPPVVSSALGPDELEALRRRLESLPEPPPRPALGRDEWLAALGVFLWVFATTFPVAIPFTFMDDAGRAVRLSNTIAVVLLFLTGYAFGRCAGYRPWLVGLLIVVLGSVLVAFTIALGG